MIAVRANQSLKLTEIAVDDFARAKQTATIGHDLAARTGFRCCGTSSPQLSSGPLGCTIYWLKGDLHIVHIYVNLV